MTSSDEHAMPVGKRREQELIDKIRRLPADRLVEVEDFGVFLCQRQEERQLAKPVTAAAETSFSKVWDNEDDAEYDRL